MDDVEVNAPDVVPDGRQTMHDPLPDPQPTAPPGSPEALDGGCLCSVLLNRMPTDRSGNDFVDPLCPLHESTTGDEPVTPS